MPTVFDSSSSAIGAITAAAVSEAQFQAQFGTGWVLADGRNVSGSRYASITSSTTVPDLRGVTLRGKDYTRGLDSGGDRTLGSLQNDAFQQHNHKVYLTSPGGLASISRDVPNPGDTVAYTTSFTRNNSVTDVYAAEEIQNGTNALKTNASETIMKNVCVNYFIRIN